MFGIDDEFGAPGIRGVLTTYRQLASDNRLILWRGRPAAQAHYVEITPAALNITGESHRILKATYNELRAMGVPERP
jgi:hypothetical protein